MFHQTLRYGALSISVIAITACGGSGSTDTSGESLIIDPVNIVTSAVEATGSDSLSSAASFPMRYVLNEPGDSQASIQTGVGLVEVIDVDTIQITLQQGDTPVQLTSTSPGTLTGTTDYTGMIDGELVTVSLSKGSGGILGFFDADVDQSGFGLTGIYGFETPTAELPTGTIVYDSAGLATAYIATSGDDQVLQVIQAGSTNPSLTVNFATSDVSGTLFDGSATVDLEDDGSENDTLFLTVDIMNGSISGGTITGEVSLTANVDLGSSGGNVDLAPTVSESFVDAAVYGITGNVVGGNFQATSQFENDGEVIDGVVGGTFFTVD